MMKRFLPLGLAALVLAPPIAEAAAVDHAVCLQTRTGKFISVNSNEPRLFARLDQCAGNAVFTIRDLNGGALTGADKVRIGNAGLDRRWSTHTGNGELVQYIRDATVGGNEYYNIHRADRRKIPIASGDKVAISGYTGWVYDSGGNGKLQATTKSIGAGETYTLIYASKPAVDAAKRAQDAALGKGGDGFHRVCLLTRGGNYVTFASGAPQIDKARKNCTGNAVLHWRDNNGGALNGEDVFYFYNAPRNNTWLENMNVHLKDRSQRVVKSGDEIHINATGGKWVYDNGGNGPLVASSGSIGAGETFTMIYAPTVDTAKFANADKTAKATAGKAAPRADALPEGGGGDSLKFGDTVLIRHGSRFLSADKWGRVSISAKADTAFRLLDENGKATGQPVKLWEKPVTLRVAKSHRWLQSSKDDDTGLIYRYVGMSAPYNFNTAEMGHNNNINNVIIWRPKIPAGWVSLGDSIFRYNSGDDYERTRDNQRTLVFKDHPTAFRKPGGYSQVWADGNGPIPPGRRAMVRADKGGGYEWVGGTFYSPWCCRGLEQARLIHQKYGAWLPLPQFWDAGATQWTARWQRYTREASAMVYDAAALIPLPDGQKFPLMWAHAWGFPLDCRSCWKGGGGRGHLVGNPGFLNGRFLKEFSYYAGPYIMRSRPGAGDAGNAPGDVTRAQFKLINPDVAKWSDTSPVVNGSTVKISHVQSGTCGGDACSLDPTASQVITNRRYRDAAAWSVARIDPKKVASRAITFKPTTGSPNEGGAGGTPFNRFGLAGGWRNYGGEYDAPALKRNSSLISLQGMTTGGNRGQQVASLPTGDRPNGVLIFNANNHDRQARIDVRPDGRVVWRAGAGAHGGWLSLANIHFTARGGRGLSLVNGWRNYGGGYAPARYDKIGNTVILTGLIKGSRFGHVATLPSGHRPPGRLIFSVNHHDQQARLDIMPDGRVIWVTGGRKHGWISLSGIVFSVRPDRSLPLLYSWRAYGGEYRLPEITKAGKLVILSGLLTGTKQRPAHLATLPSGFRPAKRLVFHTNAHDKSARVDIHSNGVVRVETGGTQYGWVSLSGIAFNSR